MEEFDRDLARAARTLNPLTLLLIDADHFKRINDEHGHAIGDEARKPLAQSISGAMRPYDRLARYGGEEFVTVSAGVSEREPNDQRGMAMFDRAERRRAGRRARGGIAAWRNLRTALGRHTLRVRHVPRRNIRKLTAASIEYATEIDRKIA